MLSIVIVNWNGGGTIEPTIESIMLQKKKLTFPFETIVVDNASSDESDIYLESMSGEINFIKLTNNIGFAGGCNFGARHARYPLLLFLNPDTAVESKSLEIAVDFLSKTESADIGIIGIQLLDETGNITRSSARFPRAGMFVAQNLALDRFFPKLGHTMKEWAHDQTREVDQVIGAFFLTRRSLFNLLGGFDDRFFVYFEEVDYAYRAKKLGFKSVYLADAQAFHEGEGTTAQIKGRRLFYLLRSRLLYGRKHYKMPENLLNFLNTLVLEPVSRAVFLTLSGRKDELPALKEGFALLYQDLPNILFRKMRP